MYLLCVNLYHNSPQALLGVAFSLGFIFGPLIGATFSVLGKEAMADSFKMYQYPACFALSLAIIDILFVAKMFQETLPSEMRVSFKSYLHSPPSFFFFLSPLD